MRIIVRPLPLDPLRTFDHAARHESFARAARALHLTDSAVSHQMRRLEDALGFRLFERRGRRLALTDAGRLFHQSVREGLATISDAASQLATRHGETSGPLAIAAPPMFASKWLAPRLGEFARTHPSIHCTIHVMDNEAIPSAAGIDVGIAFGRGGWLGKFVEVLSAAELSPACSPRLLGDRGGLIKRIDELSEVLLLHQDDGTEWRRWLAAAGRNQALPGGRHMYFTDVSVAIDVALHGDGMVLVSDVLSSQHVQDGALVRPFSTSVRAEGNWCAIVEPRRRSAPSVDMFLAWLDRFFPMLRVRGRPQR